MENLFVTQNGNLSLRTEIQFDTLLSLIKQLPKQKKLTLFNVLKKETMAERYQILSAQMPDIEEFSIENIVSEVSNIRAERYAG